MERDRQLPFITLLAILALTQVTGCGLFKTRKPLGVGPSVTCRTPNTPDDVVANILERYAEVQGLTCYLDMLDQSFAFHPDPQDSNEALPDTVYSNWDRSIEAAAATRLAGNTTFHVAAFDSEYASRVISGDQRTETRFYAYHLIIHASAVAPDTLFRGLADITFVQGSNAQWHATNWSDRRDASGARTWGYLRAKYRASGP